MAREYVNRFWYRRNNAGERFGQPCRVRLIGRYCSEHIFADGTIIVASSFSTRATAPRARATSDLAARGGKEAAGGAGQVQPAALKAAQP